MKKMTDSFVSLGHWPSAGSFGFNTDILATNPINLSVVLNVLIFFGKGVCKLHLRTISANIGMFGSIKEIIN
uniref:ATP synthase CF0 subunit I n=1 Tax=Malania oleifera TaxID=397392 RepID=A0A5C0F4X4_MALOL|nr:ATP synthase CF0 subunit I [Malania oleifera]